MSSLKYPNDLYHTRRRMNISRKRVSRLIGKTPATLHRYESGDLAPPLTTLLRLEIVYRLPVAFLYPTLYAALRCELRAKENPGHECRKGPEPGSMSKGAQ